MSWLSDITGVNIDAKDYDPNEVVDAGGQAVAAVVQQFQPAPAQPTAAAKPASKAGASSGIAGNFFSKPVAFGLSGGMLAAIAIGAGLIFGKRK